MCGRFTLYADPDLLIDYFNIENEEDFILEARYNIAPSQQIFTVVNGYNGYRGGYMRWGLVPQWAKDVSIGNKMINARSETLLEKQSFQPLLGKRHCLIIANGFYEWKKTENKKEPYYIQLKSKEPVAFAGLWDRWSSGDGGEVISCTILTTSPNTLMGDLHERMPVIIDRSQYDNWLNRDMEDYRDFFEPYPSKKMVANPVSTFVNNTRNEGEQCIN
ncbi:SOS response-associated peptidase [Evansella sp. AB-P1]|uniref:SOS response-associated peptidase n=1 Tax=Evansella sp. AB-P1 TaxID=3037653 RepID=UPI00241E774D|nr:SOS response-associated peptidase [Evansella sp. AB-P1]MDG5787495.1 SOS response-associated peptidase [Evansella sp. AB-P1]